MKLESFKKHPFGHLDHERLKQLELICGGVIPDEFLEWLVEYNCTNEKLGEFKLKKAPFTTEVTCIFGLNLDAESVQLDKRHAWLRGNLPDGRLAVADDPYGNKFVFRVFEGSSKVYYWNHETGDEQLAASSFHEFIRAIRTPTLGTRARDILDEILKGDDVEGLKRFVAQHGFEWKSEKGRSLVEIAAIRASRECIIYLCQNSSDLGNALEYAEKNAEYFDSHVPIVELLRKLSHR